MYNTPFNPRSMMFTARDKYNPKKVSLSTRGNRHQNVFTAFKTAIRKITEKFRKLTVIFAAKIRSARLIADSCSLHSQPGVRA
jgi:hypothetical protein